MPGRHRHSLRRGSRVGAVVLTAGLVLGGTAPAVWADPSAISEVRSQLVELERASAAAAERVKGAKVALARSQERLGLFSKRVASAQAELAGHHKTLSQMARQLYVDGVAGDRVLSFSLEDPDKFLDDLERLAATSSNQSGIVTKAREQATALKAASDALEREQQRLVAATDALGSLQAEADARVEQTRTLLASLEEQQRQRILAEQLAAAEQARAAAAALLAARATASATGGAQSAGTPGQPGEPATSPPANRGEAVERAVSFALSKVGGPYVWGGSGPSAFDCSGLTQAAWAQAGVALPHYSGSQYTQTAPVRYEDLQAGDLLFFYSIHQHVGIYVGDGKFVHAANTMEGIRLEALSDHYRANLVAASRPAA